MHNSPHAELLRTSHFQFNNSAVRTITKSDGSIWFVAKDITQALGYTNHRGTLIKHVDDEDKGIVRLAASTSGVPKRYPAGNGQAEHLPLRKNHRTFNIINESGMYSLVLRSQKPQAKKFQRWVTSEVLPSIRRTGSYTTRQIPANDIPDFRRVIAKFGQVVAHGDAQMCRHINKLKRERFGAAEYQSPDQTLDIVTWMAEQHQLLHPQLTYNDGFYHQNKNHANRQDVLITLEAAFTKTRDYLKKELL